MAPEQEARFMEHAAQTERAERLKERIYLTFTALAVVIAMGGHEEVTPEEALVTLLVTVAGTLLAILVADIVSHLVVHQRVMERPEFSHAVAVSFGAAGAVLLPVIFLGLAALEVWPVDRALRASSIALIAGLVVIGYLAARRVKMPWWQRVIVLAAEAALGLAVVGLELLAHG